MATITKDMGIMEIIEKWPQTGSGFDAAGYGLYWLCCSPFETIEDGAVAHGMDVDALMAALNAAVEQ